MPWFRPKPARAPQSTKARGMAGEEAAALYLAQQGYQILERNWRPGNYLRGEIDCIAWHHDERNVKVLCFVEVKTRSSNRMGSPQSAVNSSKQRQLSALANAFVSSRRWNNVPCRFDVIEVWLPDNATPTFALHQNAFDYQG